MSGRTKEVFKTLSSRLWNRTKAKDLEFYYAAIGKRMARTITITIIPIITKPYNKNTLLTCLIQTLENQENIIIEVA